MKKALLLFLLILVKPFIGIAQITSTSSTYTTGAISTQINFGGAPDTSVNSACLDTLTVTIPAGDQVVYIDLEYDMTPNGGFGFQQYSYLECFSTASKENTIYQGAGFGGTNTYSRTQIDIANGVSASGILKFGLHAFRTANGVGCDSTFQKVDNNSWKVTVYHGTPPLCLPPSNPLVDWTMSTTAKVSWVSGGAANAQIEYGPAGFVQGAGTIVSATGNTHIITGLTAATDYDFYVQDSCGATSTSPWTNVASFSTLCTPLVTPYTENFDGTSWAAGVGGANGGDAIDLCWERDPMPTAGFGGPYAIGVRSGGTGTGNTGPSGDHTTGAANYVYGEASGGGNQDEATLTSQLIDLSALTNPQINFWYHMFGTSIGTFRVDIWEKSSGWTNVFSLSGAQQTASADPWLEGSAVLSSYVNDTIRYRIRTIRSFAAQGDIAVDDISIGEAPSCPDPSNLTVSAFTYNTVTLSWTAQNAASWDIQYGAPGFNLGTGTTINTPTNPGTVTGLAFSTSYEFYVREVCSATDTSNWIGPVTATTFCAPVLAPYSEDFESSPWLAGTGIYSTGAILNPCWIRSPLNGTAGSSPYFYSVRTGGTTTGGTGPNGDNTTGAGNYIYTESSAGLPGQIADIYAPPLNLVNLTSPELRFWYHMRGGTMGTLDVDVLKVTSSGITITTEFTISGQQQATAGAVYTEAIVDLSAYAGDTIVLRFSATRGAGNQSDIALDDVSIVEAPTCPDPSNLSALSVGTTNANLQWTTGGSADWNVAYGAPGFTPGSTFNAATANPYLLTGLTANTSYDVYVRDSCGTGDVSNWIGPITIKTLCNPVNAPFLENFDGSSWVQNGNFDPGLIDGCWERSDSTTYWFKTANGGSPSNNTGPSGDHTTGTGNYLYSETNGGGTSTTIQTPPINLSALTTPELTFWYHMYGQLINTLEVEVFDGSSWTVENTLTNQQQTSSNAAWAKQIVDLSSYADTILIRFKATRFPGFNNTVDMAIDDVDVHEKPLCPEPTALSVTASTTTTVTLSWTTGGATNWQIEYGAPGFTSGSGTIVNAATNPFTVAGLSGSSTYDFYVRDSCGVASTSNWVGPVTGSTLCGIASAPYFENFDVGFDEGTGAQNTGSTIGICWSRNVATGFHWGGGSGGTPSNGTGPTGDHTSGSGNYVYTEASGGGGNPANAILTSTEIDLSPLTNPEMTFWYHMDGNNVGDLDVEVNNGAGWTSVFTQSGDQGAAWLEAIVSLSAYVNDTIEIRFTGDKATGGQNFQGDIAIDDLSIDEAPSCPKPDSMAITGVSASTVTLSWLTGGATNWLIEYGPTGFTQGAGTYLATATNPTTITGLSASTTYDFYLRDSCGVGDVSLWIGPISGTTLCGIYTAPFMENFDGAAWVPGAGGFAAGTIDSCWTRAAAANYWWKPGQGTTPTGNTGPIGDHTSGAGQFIYTESFNNSNATDIITPQIDISTLTTPELRFWHHMYGALISDLKVEIFDGSTWTTELTITGAQQTASTDAWIESVVSLSAYVGDTIIVRFAATKNAGFANTVDISIDDVKIDNVPTCPKPTAVLSTAQTTTAVTLSWTTGGATNWLIEYGPAGFTQGAGTIVPAGTNPFTVTGLSPSQNYDFYVRDSCGVADVSDWVGPLTQSTLCGTVVAPYFENFDTDFNEGTGVLNDGSTISACWTRNPDSAYHWGGGTAATGTFGTGPNSDHTSGFGNYVYTEASLTPSGSIAVLESPNIDLSTLTTPELKLWYHMDGNNMGRLEIDIYDGTVWTPIDTIDGDQGAAWLELVEDLSAYANQTVKLRFTTTKAQGGNAQSGDIALDDISIDEAPACPDPASLTATPLSTSAVQLAWTTGGATSWQIEYGPVGFTPGAGTIVNTLTNPYTVTGLTASTAYDFYVRDSCGVNDFSNWVGPISATTLSCVNGCVYTLDLSDTFGDGWTSNFAGTNYHYLDVTTAGVTTQYTLNNGAAGSFNINVCDGDSITLDFDNNGQFSDECGVVLKDASGNTVYTLTSGNNVPTGFLWSDTISCSSPCPTPTAAFTYNLTGLQINVDGSSSTGLGLTYDWSYGDGNTGNGVVDSNVYAANGTYTVTLIVTDACGQTDTITQSVSPGAICPTPTAAFTQSTSLLVLSYDASTSTGTSLTYAWDFGDGNTGTGVTGTHTYGTDGAYDVTLIVTDACGQSDTTLQSLTVCDSLTAAFTYSQSALDVTFDGSGSSAGAVTYTWDFGDGSSDTGMVFTHTYATSGTYSVDLTITNICGQSITVNQVITICVKPTASWTYQVVSSGSGGMVIQFFATNSQGASSYFWNFGDGNTNTSSAIPTHTYAVPGLFYVVTLIVYNDCGDSDTLISSLAGIGLTENELTQVTVYPNPTKGPLQIDFNQSINSDVAYEILSIDGRLIKSQKGYIENGKMKIEDLNLPAGEYLIHVNQDGIWLRRKFVIIN